MNTLIVNQVVLYPDEDQSAALSRAKKRLAHFGIKVSGEGYIYRRSIDARKKNDCHFVCSVAFDGEFPEIDKSKEGAADFSVIKREPPCVEIGKEKREGEVLVVGCGPAGLFAAILLAENGYNPILIERGADVDGRVKAVDDFKRTRILDINTNIQFGAGGAGTFSDGKLITRISDSLCPYVLSEFVKYGAPKEIECTARPHIGTDVLRTVIKNMTKRLTELGGKIYYNTRLLKINKVGGRAVSALTDMGEIPVSAIILAIGHSARDTYGTLISDGYVIEPKPFSVGVRIEHLKKDIDCALLGDFAGRAGFESAEYNLSHNTKVRGVYTFCMCPGGSVVAAASEEGQVVTNGMSQSARDGKNSNSAVAVSVFREDYGNTPSGAIEFQRKIERAAYAAGGGGYNAPICTVGDFLSEKLMHNPDKVMPTYLDGEGVKLALPDEYLPEFITSGLKNAIKDFDNKIHGFADKSALLTGAETRTSAPIRMVRTDERTALGYNNIYPCGEGAGYAGGITSAALDGIRTAIALMKTFHK